MKRLNHLNSFNFAFIAGVLIITAGISLGVLLPNLQAWQQDNIDKIISRAKEPDNSSTKLSLLEQASLLGKNDPIATQSYASALWQNGDLEKSIGVYENSLMPINYSYIGYLYLRVGLVDRAKEAFSKSVRAGETAENQSGLSLVEFIKGNNALGCNYSARAIKLNLSSIKADAAKTICEIQIGKSSLNNRQQIYSLLNSYIYAKALDRLQRLETKNSSDWQAIADIHASRGEVKDAINSAKEGLAQNPANPKLISLLIKYLDLNNQKEEAKFYNNQLEDLKFKNYPNI